MYISNANFGTNNTAVDQRTTGFISCFKAMHHCYPDRTQFFGTNETSLKQKTLVQKLNKEIPRQTLSYLPN